MYNQIQNCVINCEDETRLSEPQESNNNKIMTLLEQTYLNFLQNSPNIVPEFLAEVSHIWKERKISVEAFNKILLFSTSIDEVTKNTPHINIDLLVSIILERFSEGSFNKKSIQDINIFKNSLKIMCFIFCANFWARLMGIDLKNEKK